MITPNPFTPQSGWQPRIFGGRQEEISLFKEKLDKSQNSKPEHIVVLGEWGIGKTSLLRCFKNLAQETGDLATLCPIGRFTDKDKTIDGALLIAEELERGLPKKKEEKQGLHPPKAGSPTARKSQLQPQTYLTDKLLEIWKELDTKLAVVLLDDAQNFSPISQIIDILRLVLSREEVLKETNYQFVLACTPEAWQSFSDKHDPIGRFFRTRLILAKLSEKESAAIIEKTLQNTGVEFSKDIIQKIFEYTQGHPYELQLLCSNLYDSQIEKKVDQSVWESALDKTLRDLGREYFDVLYRQITDRERPALEALAEKDKPLSIKEIQDGIWTRIKKYRDYPLKDTKNYIYRLVDKKIVRKTSRGEYEIFDRMFREYFLKQ